MSRIRVLHLPVLLLLFLLGSVLLLYFWKAAESAAHGLACNNLAVEILENVCTNTRAVESAVRGYALTGEPAFLKKYALAANRIQIEQESLTDLARKNAVSPSELENLKALIKAKLEWEDQLILSYRHGGTDRTSKLVGSQHGAVLMNRVALFIGAMESAQYSSLKRFTSLERTSKNVQLVDIAGLLLITACLIVNVAMQRSAVVESGRERDRAYKRMEVLNNELNRQNGELLAAQQTAGAALVARREFLANVSHELRTPLTGILGASELVLATPLKEEQRDLIEICKNCGSELLDLVNDILDFEKLDRSGLRLICSELELPKLLTQTLEPLQIKAREKGLRIVLDVAENVPAVISGDPVRLRQIIVNLVDNAIKFTEKGTINIIVQRVGAEKGTGSLRFTIADTGRGIAKDQLQLIFDPFVQVDGSSTRDSDGMGLGLSIASKLAVLMGGSLSAASRLGGGSEFTLLIPIAEGQSNAPPPSIASDCGNNAEKLLHAEESKGRFAVPAELRVKNATNLNTLENSSILLVEDSDAIRRTTELQIRKLGWDVETASNGVQAVACAARKKYALILMDLQMPGTDGFMASAAIRESGLSSQTPIIAFTAHAMSAVKIRCLELGMNDCITKPVSSLALRTILNRWVDRGATSIFSPSTKQAGPKQHRG
jgi:signal transduction histidine kinase/CheY-like chemotaxis protein